MSQDQDRIKAMVSLKQRLEKRLEELDTEVIEVKSSLEAVNSILLEKGFKRGNLKDAESAPAEEPKVAVAGLKPPYSPPKNRKPRVTRVENQRMSFRLRRLMMSLSR